MLLLVGLIFLSKASWFNQNPKELAIGITLDLVIMIPLIHYFLIRNKPVSKITIVTFFVLGIAIATSVIPPEYQNVLLFITKYLVPIVELVVFYFVIRYARKIVKNYKKENNHQLDFYDALKLAFKKVSNSVITSILVVEIAVIYYCFFSWKKRNLYSNEFSYHKKSTSISIIVGIVLVILVETVALHYLLSKWNSVVAWVLTIVSMYTCLQMIALLKSLSNRPHQFQVVKGLIVLRYGLFSEAVIPIKNIQSIQGFSKEKSEKLKIKYLSPLGDLDEVNTVIRVKKESSFNGVYGWKKNYTSIAFFVDDTGKFIQELNKQILIEN